jgi:hypothetical protein
MIDFGEEQLTQPPQSVTDPLPLGYNAFNLQGQLQHISCAIREILSDRDGEPVTIYLGGAAAAVLGNLTHQSPHGISMFAATMRDKSLITRALETLEPENELRAQLSNSALQARMDEIPHVMQRLATDAATISPCYTDSTLRVVIPRWEVVYAIQMHELAFNCHSDRALDLASYFLDYYLLTTTGTTGPPQNLILESSVQEHIRAYYPDEKRYVPRSIFDKVNQRCKESFGAEPILFEDFRDDLDQ